MIGYLIWCIETQRYIRAEDAIGVPVMLFGNKTDALNWALNYWQCDMIVELDGKCDIRKTMVQVEG